MKVISPLKVLERFWNVTFRHSDCAGKPSRVQPEPDQNLKRPEWQQEAFQLQRPEDRRSRLRAQQNELVLEQLRFFSIELGNVFKMLSRWRCRLRPTWLWQRTRRTEKMERSLQKQLMIGRVTNIFPSLTLSINCLKDTETTWRAENENVTPPNIHENTSPERGQGVSQRKLDEMRVKISWSGWNEENLWIQTMGQQQWWRRWAQLTESRKQQDKKERIRTAFTSCVCYLLVHPATLHRAESRVYGSRQKYLQRGGGGGWLHKDAGGTECIYSGTGAFFLPDRWRSSTWPDHKWKLTLCVRER